VTGPSATYDIAVVGGGIAGLAIAEVFARSGRRVVLLERDAQLCQNASASQHGWFHFGSLYSIFPQNQFLRTMIGGVEDLLEHYAQFPGMNIAVTPQGRLAFDQTPQSWFRDEPIEYICCARNDPDFDMRSFDGVKDYSRKAFFLLTWEMAIKQFISRHQRFHKHNWAGPVPASRWIPRAGWTDYSREVISKPHNPGVELDRDTHFRIVGFDRPMRATAIITDLASSLIGAGGDILTGTEVERIEKQGSQHALHLPGRSIAAKTVVVAAGRWLGHFLKKSRDVKVVGSPLLVAYPRVCDLNFVRMTPFVEKSVNHIHHEVDGQRYSVIGGGYSADPDNPQAVERANQKLVDMARRVFPSLDEAKVLDSYLGFKTEIVAQSGERNYQYFMREVDDGLHAAVPGKFSLSFSLAVNTFKRLTGEEPAQAVKAFAPFEAVAPYIGPTQHARLVQRYVGRSDQQRAATLTGSAIKF
jgi:glycine/D-amino acid oxidase-like deaminating enzyme